MPSFSRDLERTLQRALTVAGEKGQAHATPHHLALALIEAADVADLLRGCDVDADALRAALERVIGGLPATSEAPGSSADPDEAFKRVVQRCVIHVQSARRDAIDDLHMMLALVSQPDSGATLLLHEAGLTRYDATRYARHGLRKSDGENDRWPVAFDARVAVRMFNDDDTPMEFVMDVLRSEFGLSADEATRLMLEIHQKGSALCGTYPHETAVIKLGAVAALAREHQHPLHCVLESREV